MKIEVPAHSHRLEKFQKLTVVMHAGGIGHAAYWHKCGVKCKNNMLMMTDTTCEIMDIPDDVYPVDVAIGITEINSTLVAEDWEERHFADTNTTLSKAIQDKLHPDFKHMCQGKHYESSVKRQITKEDADLFRRHEGIYTNTAHPSNLCGIRVKTTNYILYKNASPRKSHSELRTRSPGCGLTKELRAATRTR